MGVIVIMLLISYVIANSIFDVYLVKQPPKTMSIIVALFMSVLGFYAISICTISPEVTSGNGNIAIVFLPIAIAPFLLLNRILVIESESLHRKFGGTVALLFIALGMALLCHVVDKELQFAGQLIEALGGAPNNPESRIYRFGWINQYTNTIFINSLTFAGCLILSLVIGGIRSMLSKE